MTLYDSSVLIDYLTGEDAAVEYVERNADERAVAPPLVMYEVYEGEIYRPGEPDFESVDDALSWLQILNSSQTDARAAAELQADLQQAGATLAPRDALIAGTAKSVGENFAVADADFDVEGIDELIDVDFVE